MQPTDQHKLRVLAVDDEPDVLRLYRHALSPPSSTAANDLTFEITCCSRGEASVAAVADAIHTGRPYAVIFLDVKLPSETSGLTFGARIREMDPNVNFVVVTGLPDISPKEISRRIPPQDKLLYIQKPFHISEIRQFAAALGAKWQSEMLLRRANAELERKVSELEHNRKALMDSKADLEYTTRQLMETNDALSVLARNIERTRRETEQRVSQRAVMLMMPIVETLQRDPRLRSHRTDLKLLAGYINDLATGFSGELRAGALLSATELRIASMIRNGMTSREIANHLFISDATVKTHRKNIRKKLKLRNAPVNLRTYLAAEMGPDETPQG